MRVFRREQRNRVYQYEIENMELLSKTEEIDQKYFWYMINKQKKRKQTVNPILDDSGELLTDVNDIRNEWNAYYEKLYNWEDPTIYDVNFSTAIEHEITSHFNSINEETYLRGGRINAVEVSCEVSKMKNKKAPGHDNITAEHLKNLGANGIHILVWIMNTIVETENIPQSLKKGLLCPLPKSRKDPTVKDFNRGITLLNTIYKLLEKIILNREKDWFNNVCTYLQGVCVDNCSSLHTSMILQEGIAFNCYKGETVYTAFLDIKKAFDHVWVEGLIFKLYKLGIDSKVLRLIRECYSHFQCAAFIGGESARWFLTGRGVHQGGPLSMMLYVIYVNDLLKELQLSMYGIEMFGIDLTCPSYADDMTTIALHKIGLNELLRKSYEHSIKWRYCFSENKCNFMVWGIDRNPNEDIRLGNFSLECKESVKHVGITLTNSQKASQCAINERIATSRKLLHSVRGLGSHSVPVSPTVMSKLYWSVIVPRFTYGLEVCCMTDSHISSLEEVHRQNAKLIQGLPISTPNPAPLATLGWLSMSSFIVMKKILFLWKIMCLPRSSLYRRLATYLIEQMQTIHTVPYNSPIYDMYQCICLYGLQDHFSIVMNSFNVTNYIPWKIKIKKLVWDTEVYRWKATCSMYHQLSNYSISMEAISMNIWWRFAQNNPRYVKKVSAVVALLCGTQPKQLQRNLESHKSKCLLCNSICKDDLHHVIVDCPKMIQNIETFWRDIYDKMPLAMSRDIKNMNRQKSIDFLISGLGGKYVKEWDPIYANIVTHIWNIYEKRAMKIDLKFQSAL